jgi:hypothetical protein
MKQSTMISAASQNRTYSTTERKLAANPLANAANMFRCAPTGGWNTHGHADGAAGYR